MANEKLPYWIVPVKDLILSDKVGDWCQIPYPGHKNGCPNYNKKHLTCPPIVPNITELMDILKPMYIVHSEFNLKAHSEKMKLKHPEWSYRQCRCLLYWQNTSRKQMRERTQHAVRLLKTDRNTACPEGMGVNVFATAFASGLKLDKTKNIEICRHITLIGHSKESQRIQEGKLF